MEASAFIAVSRYSDAGFAQVLYAGDSLAGPTWEERAWTRATPVRERLFWLAPDACLHFDAARSTAAS